MICFRLRFSFGLFVADFWILKVVLVLGIEILVAVVVVVADSVVAGRTLLLLIWKKPGLDVSKMFKEC